MVSQGKNTEETDASKPPDEISDRRYKWKREIHEAEIRRKLFAFETERSENCQRGRIREIFVPNLADEADMRVPSERRIETKSRAKPARIVECESAVGYDVHRNECRVGTIGRVGINFIKDETRESRLIRSFIGKRAKEMEQRVIARKPQIIQTGGERDTLIVVKREFRLQKTELGTKSDRRHHRKSAGDRKHIAEAIAGLHEAEFPKSEISAFDRLARRHDKMPVAIDDGIGWRGVKRKAHRHQKRNDEEVSHDYKITAFPAVCE